VLAAVPNVRQALSHVGIGASEIASACGISRYRSRFGLWLEKTGRRPPFAGNVNTRLGQLLEPRARQLYANATGLDVCIPPASMFHPTVSWARATPDGIVMPRETSRHGMQIKCVGYFIGKRMRYELPLEYEAQVQWEMFVADLDRVDLAVLVGSDELEWERFMLGELTDPAELFARTTLDIHTIYRSEPAIASLLAGGRAFLDLVESDTQPPVDESPDATHYYNDRARTNRPTVIIDEADVGDRVSEYRAAYLADKAADRAIDLAKNRIREAMDAAGANRITTTDGPIDLRIAKNGTVSLHAPRAWSSNPEES
jgi:putative phage-type endonuclease